MENDRSKLYKELAELTAQIKKIERELYYPPEQGPFSCLWKNENAVISVVLDEDLGKQWSDAKLNLAKKFLNIMKKQQKLLEKRLKSDLK